MKIFVSLLSMLLLFSSCEKEKKKYKVSYKVTMISGNPAYSVRYSSSNNSTQSQGPINKSMWTSPVIEDREEGGSVSLTLEGGGGASYNM